eukprot:g2705.t1
MLDKSCQAVIVGVGRTTDRRKNDNFTDSFSPVTLFVDAANKAAFDATDSESMATKLLQDVAIVACPETFLDLRWRAATGFFPFHNLPQRVAEKIGANAKCMLAKGRQGNSPQFLVSLLSDEISKGRVQGPVLIGGVEVIDTFKTALKLGKLDDLTTIDGWTDQNKTKKRDELPISVQVGPNSKLSKDETMLEMIEFYTFGFASIALNAYPLFENAYCTSKKRTREEHLNIIASLFSKLSEVASEYPEHSWYPKKYTSEYLKQNIPGNRMISFPYRKWMCARDEVNQSACILLMSAEEAEKRGIDERKLVYIHGSGDMYDSNAISLRRQFDYSTAMLKAYEEAFRSAELGKVDGRKISIMDLYSCFPIAVELACDVLQIDYTKVDGHRITTTGGLAYHGGPGANYSSHGLVALVEKLRTDQYRGKYGLLGANGGFLTEHSIGIYNTKPPKQNYFRRNMENYNGKYNIRPLPLASYAFNMHLNPNSCSVAKIITYTIRYKRVNGVSKEKNVGSIPDSAIIIGEMKENNLRILATTKENDLNTVNNLVERNCIGETVMLESSKDLITLGEVEFYPVYFFMTKFSNLCKFLFYRVHNFEFEMVLEIFDAENMLLTINLHREKVKATVARHLLDLEKLKKDSEGDREAKSKLLQCLIQRVIDQKQNILFLKKEMKKKEQEKEAIRRLVEERQKEEMSKQKAEKEAELQRILELEAEKAEEEAAARRKKAQEEAAAKKKAQEEAAAEKKKAAAEKKKAAAEKKKAAAEKKKAAAEKKKIAAEKKKAAAEKKKAAAEKKKAAAEKKNSEEKVEKELIDAEVKKTTSMDELFVDVEADFAMEIGELQNSTTEKPRLSTFPEKEKVEKRNVKKPKKKLYKPKKWPAANLNLSGAFNGTKNNGKKRNRKKGEVSVFADFFNNTAKFLPKKRRKRK